MKTKSKNDGPRGLSIRFFGVNAIVEAAQPEQARLDAMTKGYLMCREVHSLFLDHLDAWNDWRTEHAKGLQADTRLVLSLYGRLQRITEELLVKGHDPIDWSSVGADVIIVRKSRLERGTGNVVWDPLTPVTPFVQPTAAGRALKAKLEAGAEAHSSVRREMRHGYHNHHRAPREPRQHIEQGPTNPVLSPEDIDRLFAQRHAEPIQAVVPVPEEPAETIAPVEVAPEPEVVASAVDPEPEPLPIERITEINAAFAGEHAAELTAVACGAETTHVETTPETTTPYGLSELEPGVEPEGIVTTMEPIVAEETPDEPEADTAVTDIPYTAEQVAEAVEKAASSCCTDLQEILDQLPHQIMLCTCGNKIQVGK